MESSLKDTLEDVRASYRLIYEYQRRMLDLIDYCAKFYGRKIDKSISKFSASPKRHENSMNRWAWDWLTMYCTEYSCTTIEVDDSIVYLSFILVSDTGFFDKELQDKMQSENKSFEDINSRIDISKFNTVEESKSKIVMIASQGIEPINGIFDTSVETLKLILDDKGHYVNKDETEIRRYKSYNLETFGNLEKTTENLKDFELFCNTNSIEIRNI